MKLGANQAELVQLMQKFMQRSRVGIFRNEGRIHTIGSQTHVLVRFVMVWVHLDHFVTAKNSVQIGSN